MQWRGRDIAALLLALVVVAAARAQEPPHVLPEVVVRAPRRPNLLPETIISPPSPPKDAGSNNIGSGSGEGTSDKSGDAKSIERLNQILKRKVDEINPSFNTPPLDARSPDTKIGVINIPAVQQQYGQNFGRSAVPYRPPPPIYVSPLGHH